MEAKRYWEVWEVSEAESSAAKLLFSEEVLGSSAKNKCIRPDDLSHLLRTKDQFLTSCRQVRHFSDPLSGKKCLCWVKKLASREPRLWPGRVHITSSKGAGRFLPQPCYDFEGEVVSWNRNTRSRNPYEYEATLHEVEQRHPQPQQL